MNLVATICLLSLVTAGTNSQVSSSTNVPEWVGEELPFDASLYFTLPEQNAAPFYKLAFEEFSEEMYWENPETKRAKSIRDRQALFDKIYRRFQNDPTVVESLQIDRVLGSYEQGIALLRIAQRQPDCVFTSSEIEGIDTAVFTTHLAASREVLKVLDLKVFHNLRSRKVSEAIALLGIQLRLARDLRPRGQDVDQLVASQLEQVAFEEMVPRILSDSTLDPEECRRLLELLVQHQQANDIDPVLESEQYNQLFWRKLFSQLEQNEFHAGAIAAEYDLQIANPTAGTVLIPLFDHIFMYDLNSDELRNIAQRLAKEDPRLAELHERVRELAKADGLLGEKLDETIAGLVIQKRIGRKQNVDFSNDRKILNRRYAQIAEVRQLAEPRRVKKLEAFEQQWAPDSDVSNTTLLQLFEPAPIAAVGRAEQRSTLSLSVAQCLTAVKHWELEHGKLPPDLKSAITNVGFNGVPLDPHNGEPIELQLNDEPVIYASGADRQWPIPQTRTPGKDECAGQ